MREENGTMVPGTLGEYRDICAAIGGESCRAVQFLDERIAAEAEGRESAVLAPDSQMRHLLMPMLLENRREL